MTTPTRREHDQFADAARPRATDIHTPPDPYWAGQVRQHQPLNVPDPATTWFESQVPVQRTADARPHDELIAMNLLALSKLRSGTRPPAPPKPAKAPRRKRSFLEWFRRMRLLALVCGALRVA